MLETSKEVLEVGSVLLVSQIVQIRFVPGRDCQLGITISLAMVVELSE